MDIMHLKTKVSESTQKDQLKNALLKSKVQTLTDPTPGVPPHIVGWVRPALHCSTPVTGLGTDGAVAF
eukprot:CAMPEP_0174300820 /NCGR_PEP_ID=MMETSP0809-20121228/58689_1 /TAXON_ID=73025 ORGANISM="Eutreptiella gymnastica-like, Strain CCMP1594" /NCGR_SAMPLE_ID=MMETSP0809 /ASSEMBLY_ACC=CAM_ASM_000658 /LENGTH=67 /DNA_ID=CAMNT_0015406473 /DNA_START=535 /DNA_END=738 /DNA_ORIENTATION=-